MNELVKSASEPMVRLWPWIRSIIKDRVVQFVFGLLVLISIVDRPAIPVLLGKTLESLVYILPFILLSITIAAGIKATGADASIGRSLQGRWAIVTAAVFGALSPFCSCGVVPLIAALLAAGVPLAPVMAFWLASPVIDPEMLILTWSILGLPLALTKTIAAMIMGLLGGGIILVMDRSGLLADPLKAQASTGSSCCSSSGPKDESIHWAFWHDADRRRSFADEALTMGLFLFKWLTFAFFLEAMMIMWVPLDQLTDFMTGLGSASIPFAALVGVPAYLNGYAAIPLMRGMIDAGLDPSAALTFMVAGGVTSIPAAIAVYALVKWRIFLLYLVIALAGSALIGWASMPIL